MTLRDEFPRSLGAQYAIGEEWRNSSRRSKEAEPKQKQCQVVDVSGGKGSTLAWKIPWMDEPDRLQSMMSLRVGHD